MKDREALVNIKPESGYPDAIGQIVGQLNFTKRIIINKVADLTQTELDARIPFHSNSIGTLLKHMIAVEKIQQTTLFEYRGLNANEKKVWAGSLPGHLSWERVNSHEIDYYIKLWEKVRNVTLTKLKSVEDNWLYFPANVNQGYTVSNYYCLFHLMEDQLCHYGQIRGLIKTLRNLSSLCIVN